jgi:hypothetical protein
MRSSRGNTIGYSPARLRNDGPHAGGTACEFWAAARNGSLIEHLRENPPAQLRAAEAAFTVVGLTKAPSVLHHGRRALTESDPPVSLQSVVEFIETSLAELGEPVDRMIADYAAQQTLDRQSKHK